MKLINSEEEFFELVPFEEKHYDKNQRPDNYPCVVNTGSELTLGSPGGDYYVYTIKIWYIPDHAVDFQNAFVAGLQASKNPDKAFQKA